MPTIPENNGSPREAVAVSIEGQNRYRPLLNMMRESILEIDANWQIIFTNDRFIEMSGYARDKIIGKSLFDVVNQNRLPSLRKQFNFRKQGNTNSYIVELLTIDNSEIMKTEFQNPYFNSKGNYQGEFGVISDIRQPELPAEKFRSKKEIYQFLAENMGDIVWTLDVDLNTVYVSPSVENVLGFTPEERKRQKVEDIMTPESLERVTAVYLDALQVDQEGNADPNRSLTVEVEYYHRNGSTVWLENMIKAHRDETGKIIGVYGVSRDITKRKLAEERIIQANEEWEQTFNSASELISILDNRYRIIRLNKAMADKLGVNVKDAIGGACYKCVHGTEEPPLNCPHRQLLKDGLGHKEEIFEERLGGYYLVTVSPIFDPKGQLVGSVHIAHDISEIKRAEKEKEKLIAELQKSLANIKTLKGLLPICASCKKIRDDKGYWDQIESYFDRYSDVEFSHGICPDCAKKLYPEYDLY